ncbi:hypothetical protein VC83_06361 [Pseudogymnoascus destructans]|uniref:2EXR domain-containing protein n=1 Tax=Pseudogymnoascus destructans TaxID=655981 RepID=A0A177A8D7_9PEZI|nr:uncharacterized protein VC83_06361 [Pseudogymnoascus destructans]OAF58407.1 hypothetical protein VC83_06361 [Pseudogymnoascus destructans]
MSGYLAGDDKEWLVEEQPRREEPVRRFIDGEGGELDIPGHEGRETGAKAITFCVYVELSEYDTPSPTRTRVRFTAVHGGFPGLDIEDEDVKKRVWESMGIQVGAEAGDRGVGFAEEFGFGAALPVEIQIMIWQHTIHSIPGRGILQCYGPNRLLAEVLNRTMIPAAVLHACYLSRLLARERWTLGIPNDATADKKVYIDVKRDAIFYLGYQYFPNLPVEIQTMIWQHAIHSIPGRDFIIRYSSIPQALQIGPAHGRWTEIISPTWTVIPAVLHTCQLSRLLAQDRWTLDIPSY